MKYIRKVVGMGVAALTDVAIGVIIVHLIGRVFSYDIPIYFYPIGAFLALFPDIDYPYHLWQVWLKKRKFYESHRTVPHYPIMIIPFCFVLGVLSIFWPIFLYWTVVAGLCLFSHYIHDSIEGKIRWLAPKGEKYYGFFTEKGGKKHLVVSCSEDEWKSLVMSRLKSADYFETHYLRVTKESVIGVLLFIVAIVIVYLWR